MKKILLLLFCLISMAITSQTAVLHAGEKDWPIGIIQEQQIQSELKTSQVMSCAAGTIFTTGYPNWTNYYSGYMFKINNISTCPITIKCFEARFQGTSGYQIHTKTGTFIGFETNSLAWTLVGSVANGVASISTITCSPIPIAVNITIPAGASQSFYLTRNDNVVANRHLYITGVGTAGTTVYAADANIQITEAEYLNFPFGPLQIGVRRPSFDVYYDRNCALPIELISFEGKNISNYNNITWSTAIEVNNSHFILERSTDASNWMEIDRMDGTNQHEIITYVVNDKNFEHVVNYYRLTQVDFDGSTKYSDIIAINNNKDIPIVIKIRNILGQEVSNDFKGIKIVYYSNGTVQKVVD